MIQPSDRILGQGRFLTLVDRDGWEFASRLAAREVVGIVAWTVDDRLLLVEQDRPAVGGRTIELPAGLVGDEPGTATTDTVDRAAARELLEETGHVADSFELLWRGAASAGLSDEMVSLVAARGVRRVGDGGGVGSERIVVHAVPRDELRGWLAERARAGLVLDIKVGLALGPA